jgi:DNA-binding transcriptional LysR family regulator
LAFPQAAPPQLEVRPPGSPLLARKRNLAGSNARDTERESGPPAIDLRHLRYFLAVSEELHFGRAAERLHIAQPPLSQAIRKLEAELGVQLLHRTSRVVMPTDAGVVFAEEARKVLGSFERAVTEARRAGGAEAVLRIGCIPYLPIAQLLDLLEALHEEIPGWRTQVTHLLALEQVSRLRSGRLDVGVFYGVEDYEDLELEPLFPGEPLVAYLPQNERRKERNVIGPDDVVDEVMYMFKRSLNPAFFDWLTGSLKSAGFRFRDVREVGGWDARDMLLALAAGSGVTFGPFSLRDVGQVGDVVERRRLDPPLTMPDTVVAFPSLASSQLGEVLAGVRRVAAELRRSSEDEPPT